MGTDSRHIDHRVSSRVLWAPVIVCLFHGSWSMPVHSAAIEVSTGEASPGSLRLIGSRDRRQLIVTATPGSPETAHDVTATTAWRVEPPTLAVVQPGGLVVPLSDGAGVITASVPDEAEVSVPLVIERFGDDPPIDFVSQVVPVFTKHGCNGGGCHGKSGGQNGFRLSLLGFEPGEDHEHLLKEARGRRISLAAPETSLLLAKASATVPHGGGKLIGPESPAHDLLVRWIAEGANPSGPNPPQVSHIEVFPSERMLAAGRTQQLRVLAHFNDGRIEDVTRLAQFETNAPDLATVNESGLVTANEPGDGPARCGTAAVMVRYQSRVAVFRGTLPLATPLERMPSAEQFVRNFIDEHVLAHFVKLRLPPSPLCDDATFLRRVTIDIAGRLPMLEETNEFLADSSPTKRDALVDRLLDSPDYADYFALKWSVILRNKRTDDQLHRNGTYTFHAWIRDQLAKNTPYSEFVGEILTASGEVDRNPAVVWYRQVADINQQVEDAAQLFMGQRLQCARCHHHPFEKWGTEDYFQLAAFFSRVGRKKGLQPGEDRIFHNRGAAQANGPKGAHKPATLGFEPVDVPVDTDPRRVLAEWMVSPDNPFFARSLVNRYWKHFFSIGLVEPEDDMRLTNPATNPALLDALANSFVQSGFDMKELIRTICRSNTYQLMAEPNEFNAEDRQSFSRFFARRLPAEVALDAIDRLTGARTDFAGMLPGTRAVELPDPNFNNYFLTVFGRPNGDSACECERGVEANLAQSLHLINSSDILAKLGGSRSSAFASDQTRAIGDKIDELYRIAVSRPAKPEEAAEIDRYISARLDKPKEAWEDVVWSLLNTKEFLFNH